MDSFLINNIGASATNIIIVLAALAVVILAIIALMALLRAKGGRAFGFKKSKKIRLSILDTISIDRSRKLLLIKRDNVEHLILIGGPTDVLIEKNISFEDDDKLHNPKTHTKTQDKKVDAISDKIAEQHTKDADVTKDFNSYLEESDLIYDTEIDDTLHLNHNIDDDIIVEKEIKETKPASQKAVSKPDIIKALLGRNRSKDKKNHDKNENNDKLKDGKQSKSTQQKLSLKEESDLKNNDKAKVTQAVVEKKMVNETPNHIDEKPSKTESTKTQVKAQEQEEIIVALEEQQPETILQVERNRIVHEFEGGVGDDLPNVASTKMQNTAPEIDSKIAQAPITANSVENIALAKAPPVAIEAPGVATAAKIAATATLAGAMIETAKAQSTTYHAPVEKMHLVEPVEKLTQSLSPQAAQATALKIQDEEEYEVMEVVKPLAAENRAQQGAMENVKPALKNNTALENIKEKTIETAQHVASTQNISEVQQKIAPKEQVLVSLAPSEMMSITAAPLYGMQELQAAPSSSDISLRLENNHILTQNSAYTTPVVDNHTLEIPPESVETRNLANIQPPLLPTDKPYLQAENIKDASITAEIEGRREPSYAVEFEKFKEPIGNIQEPVFDSNANLDKEFDSMFEDELREMVKSDKFQ